MRTAMVVCEGQASLFALMRVRVHGDDEVILPHVSYVVDTGQTDLFRVPYGRL